LQERGGTAAVPCPTLEGGRDHGTDRRKSRRKGSATVSNLKAKLLEKNSGPSARTTKLVKEQGKIVIDQVTIGQCIGGAATSGAS